MGVLYIQVAGRAAGAGDWLLPEGSAPPLGAPTLLDLVERSLLSSPGRDGGSRRLQIGPVGEALLLELVSGEADGPLRPLRAMPGLRRSLGRIFSALSCAEASPQLLPRLAERVRRSDSSRSEATADKLAALGHLYLRYRSLLGPQRLDGSLAFAAGVRALAEPTALADLCDLPSDATLVIHGLHRLPIFDCRPTPHGLLAAIAALARLDAQPARQVRLVLPTLDGLHPDDTPGDDSAASNRPSIEQALRPILDAVYQRHDLNLDLSWVPLGPQLVGDGAHSVWGRFLRGLFRSPRQPPLLATDELSSAQLALRALPNPASEAREVARTIRDLLDRGVPPTAIALVAESPLRRRRLIEALHRYDIPLALAPPYPANSSVSGPLLGSGSDDEPLPPPLALLLSLYELLEQRDGLPREALIQLLTTRYLRWPAGRDAKAPPWQVARALRGAGIRELGLGLELLTTAGGSPAEQQRRIDEWLRQQRRGVDGDPAVVGQLEAILEQLRQLPREGTIAQHVTALQRLCGRLRLSELTGRLDSGWLGRARVAASDDEPTLDDDAMSDELLATECRAIARDQAAIGKLEQALAELPRRCHQLRQVELPLSRARFAALLRQTLLSLQPTPSPASDGCGVEVGSLGQLQRRPLSHLFVVGMLEGELPAPAAADPLLDDDERRLCNRLLDRPLFPLAQQVGQRAALLFAELLAHAEAAHLSFALADEEGRPLQRSPLIDCVLAAARRDEPTLEPQPLVPYAEEARHRSELFARASQPPVGRELRRPPTVALATRLPAEALSRALHRRDRGRAGRLLSRIELETTRALWWSELATGKLQPGPGPQNGQLGDATLIAALSPRLPGSVSRPLSASALEDYARCPFRFFVYRVLQAAPIPEGGDDLDPLARGNLYHKALEHFFTDRRDGGRLPLRGDSDDREALERAIEAAVREFADAERSGHPALFQVRLRRLRSELWQLVSKEAQTPIEPDCQPALFEHQFGPLRIAAVDGSSDEEPLHIHGVIDRIDLGPGRAVVLDYKTGRRERYQAYLRDELLSTSFQLPLYAAAAQADAAVRAGSRRSSLSAVDGEPPPEVSARYYAVRQAAWTDALDAPGLFALDPEHRRQVGAHNVAEAAYALWRRLRSGDFRVAPRTCDGCGLEAVCRITTPPASADDSADDPSQHSPSSGASSSSGNTPLSDSPSS